MRDSILQSVSFRFIFVSVFFTSVPSCTSVRRPRPRNCVYCSPCSHQSPSTKGPSATSRRLSRPASRRESVSQRARVPEYAAPQPSSSRRHRPRQPPHISTLVHQDKTLHAALAFTLDDARLACIPPQTTHYFLALHRIILIQPVSACCDPHPGTLSTLIRFSQLRGNASCLSQPPILDSPTPALGHLQHLCFSHHQTRPRRQGLLLHQK